MSGKSIISNSYLEDIGDAIRYKKGTEETFYPSQMGDAIRSIDGIVPTGTMEIDANGVYDVTEKASVDVDVVPDLRHLNVDSLTQSGTFVPDGFDGYDSITVEEDWDGTLYPITDETDPIYDIKPFDAHWVQLDAGDTIIIEGYGRGRWVGFRGITTTTISSLPSTVNIGVRSAPQFDYLRFKFDAVEDCIAVLCGTNGNREGAHSGQVGYCFCGDWLRWKVIHQP